MWRSVVFHNFISPSPIWKISWQTICQYSVKVIHVSPRVFLSDLWIPDTLPKCLLKSVTTLPWSNPQSLGAEGPSGGASELPWDFKFFVMTWFQMFWCLKLLCLHLESLMCCYVKTKFKKLIKLANDGWASWELKLEYTLAGILKGLLLRGSLLELEKHPTTYILGTPNVSICHLS